MRKAHGSGALAAVAAFALCCGAATTTFSSSLDGLLPGCRRPDSTAELVSRVERQWPNWTVEKTREFWPDPLNSGDVPRKDDARPPLQNLL